MHVPATYWELESRRTRTFEHHPVAVSGDEMERHYLPRRRGANPITTVPGSLMRSLPPKVANPWEICVANFHKVQIWDSATSKMLRKPKDARREQLSLRSLAIS
jgi:hypothetical protein